MASSGHYSGRGYSSSHDGGMNNLSIYSKTYHLHIRYTDCLLLVFVNIFIILYIIMVEVNNGCGLESRYR